MNKIVEELKKVKVFFIATNEGTQPRVRPFGSITEFEGNAYICCGNFKEVYKQIMNNSKIELCGMYDDTSWLRVTARCVEDNRIEVQKAMLDDPTGPKGLYEAGDGKFVTFRLENVDATKFSFTSAPEKIVEKNTSGELRELYDKDSNPTGKFYHKGDPIPTGFYPMVVMLCIQNSEGKFLMQKRVAKKGGDWGVTGGHPKAGETPLQGMFTEAREELGIDISNQKLEIYSQGCDGTDCYIMYYVKMDLDTSKLQIQEDELTEVRWFSMQELEDMVEKHILNPNQIACFVKCEKYLKETGR